MSDHQYDDIHDLLVRAPVPDMSYDLSATLTTGRRIRRRRLAAAGGGVAALVAMAIAFGALGPLPGRDAQPAGPVSTDPATGGVSTRVLEARYDVEVFPHLAADEDNVQVSAIDDTWNNVPIGHFRADPNAISLGAAAASDGSMVGTAPARATSFFVVTAGALGTGRADVQPLPGTEFQAFGVDFRDAGAGVFRDVIWSDGTAAFDRHGALLPSAILPGKLSTLVVYAKEHVMADLRHNGLQAEKYAPGSTPWLGLDVDPRASKIQFLGAAFALPTGERTATGITVTWNNGLTTSGTVVGRPGSEWTFVHTTRDGSKTAPAGEVFPTSVEWTDTAGTRHTEPVERQVP